MKPNFLIVGAAKCGTTSMYQYLSQHPDIFMPQWKELSFFIGDPHGPVHKVKKPRYYTRVFRLAKNQTAVGEASTSYLYDEAAPGIIKEKLGSIKILISLRDPVAMSYSLYNHQTRKEGETIKSFEAALEAEAGRKNDPDFKKNCYGWHANYSYFQRGLYFEQVRRYIATFGKSQVKIVLFEDFIRDPVKIVREIYRFLGVDETFIPAIEVHNPAGGIISIPEFWRDKGLFLKTFQYVFSKNIIKKIPHLLRNIGRKPPTPLNPVTEQYLRQKFLDDIRRLEKLIGRDLSAWKN